MISFPGWSGPNYANEHSGKPYLSYSCWDFDEYGGTVSACVDFDTDGILRSAGPDIYRSCLSAESDLLDLDFIELYVKRSIEKFNYRRSKK